MILGLLLYGITVSLILTAAGFAMEPLAARVGWPRRIVWAGALLLSVGIPVVIVSTPHAPAVTGPNFILSNSVLRSRDVEDKPALPTISRCERARADPCERFVTALDRAPTLGESHTLANPGPNASNTDADERRYVGVHPESIEAKRVRDESVAFFDMIAPSCGPYSERRR
jgi:hypothetical protein